MTRSAARSPLAAARINRGSPRSFASYRGETLILDRSKREDFVVQSLGPPYWRDEDETAILLFDEFDGVAWPVAFSPQPQ
jgi:hypothetical protein